MSLSDKIYEEEFSKWLKIEDVKEFIRELKEKLQHTNGCGRSCNEGFSDSFNCGDGHLCFECEYDLFHKIDNLAGDKLI